MRTVPDLGTFAPASDTGGHDRAPGARRRAIGGPEGAKRTKESHVEGLLAGLVGGVLGGKGADSVAAIPSPGGIASLASGGVGGAGSTSAGSVGGGTGTGEP